MMNVRETLDDMISDNNPNNVKDYYENCCWVFDCFLSCFKCISRLAAIVATITLTYFIGVGIAYGYIVTKHPDGMDCSKSDMSYCYSFGALVVTVLLGAVFITCSGLVFMIKCYLIFQRIWKAYNTAKTGIELQQDENNIEFQQDENSIELQQDENSIELQQDENSIELQQDENSIELQQDENSTNNTDINEDIIVEL
jgi:hypothetical protein